MLKAIKIPSIPTPIEKAIQVVEDLKINASLTEKILIDTILYNLRKGLLPYEQKYLDNTYDDGYQNALKEAEKSFHQDLK